MQQNADPACGTTSLIPLRVPHQVSLPSRRPLLGVVVPLIGGDLTHDRSPAAATWSGGAGVTVDAIRRPGNGVKGSLPPIDEGKGPFTPRAKTPDWGRGPRPQDGHGAW